MDANQEQQGQPAIAQAAAAPVIQVARTPAQYSICQPLNFSECNDITIFKNGCAPLDGEKYDATKLNLFLTSYNQKQDNSIGTLKECLPMVLMVSTYLSSMVK